MIGTNEMRRREHARHSSCPPRPKDMGHPGHDLTKSVFDEFVSEPRP